jgi:hypothetical protein
MAFGITLVSNLGPEIIYPALVPWWLSLVPLRNRQATGCTSRASCFDSLLPGVKTRSEVLHASYSKGRKDCFFGGKAVGV